MIQQNITRKTNIFQLFLFYIKNNIYYLCDKYMKYGRIVTIISCYQVACRER